MLSNPPSLAPLEGRGFEENPSEGPSLRDRGSISHRTKAGRDRRAAGDSLVSHGQTKNSTFRCWKEKCEEKKKNSKPCGSFLSAAARTEGALGSPHGARTGWDGTGWWQRGGGVPLIFGYFYIKKVNKIPALARLLGD